MAPSHLLVLLLLLHLPFPSSAFSLLPPAGVLPGAFLAPPPQQDATPLAPILGNLGFEELATVVSALALPLQSGPLTLFAPSDDSIRSCSICSASALLREHLVPGLFPRQVLSQLASGTKLETSAPSCCLTITASRATDSIFVDGVEVTRPDLFNDGRLVIHGLQGFVAPLSPLSCGQQKDPERPYPPPASPADGAAIVRLMFRDAIVRLRDGGFSILALAMRVKFSELAGLQNMTVFALDDDAIFAGGHSYVTRLRFHIVPNRLLMHGDLVRLPAGATLPTLVRGQDLVVTHASGGDPFGQGLRINYVPLKRTDAVYNAKVAVHSIFLPFPYLQPSDLGISAGVAAGNDGIFGSPPSPLAAATESGICDASAAAAGSCLPSATPPLPVLDVVHNSQ